MKILHSFAEEVAKDLARQNIRYAEVFFHHQTLLIMVSKPKNWLKLSASAYHQ